LTITVEIGGGRQAQILIHEYDNPEDLAVDFCSEHGISENLIPLLAEQIALNMESVLQEEVN